MSQPACQRCRYARSSTPSGCGPRPCAQVSAKSPVCDSEADRADTSLRPPLRSGLPRTRRFSRERSTRTPECVGRCSSATCGMRAGRETLSRVPRRGSKDDDRTVETGRRRREIVGCQGRTLGTGCTATVRDHPEEHKPPTVAERARLRELQRESARKRSCVLLSARLYDIDCGAGPAGVDRITPHLPSPSCPAGHHEGNHA